MLFRALSNISARLKTVITTEMGRGVRESASIPPSQVDG
jgi:hypothetical protein